MREVFILIAHLLATLVRLARPRGLGAVAAESLAVKHELLIMKRAQRLKPFPVWEREAKLKLDHLASERITCVVRCGTSGFPAGQITAAAKDFDADLIVMATRGHSRSAVEHLLLGSVAERVVRSSICPVPVVPAI
jgi:nucleotide-binding universal stress UspA family protein